MLTSIQTDKPKYWPSLRQLGVRLDAPTMDDAAAFSRHFQGEVARLATLDEIEPMTVAESAEFLADRLADEQTRAGILTRAVRLTEAEPAKGDKAGELVGMLGTAPVPGFDERNRVELGFWLAKAYWGRGIMTVAIGDFCSELARREDAPRTVSVGVRPDHEISRRVLERNGFYEVPGDGPLTTLELRLRWR